MTGEIVEGRGVAIVRGHLKQIGVRDASVMGSLCHFRCFLALLYVTPNSPAGLTTLLRLQPSHTNSPAQLRALTRDQRSLLSETENYRRSWTRSSENGSRTGRLNGAQYRRLCAILLRQLRLAVICIKQVESVPMTRP